MTVIDQRVTWAAVEARLAAEDDQVLRRNLSLLLAHMRAEAALDMEPLMATVSDRAHYHVYGDESGASDLVGKSAVRAFYEAFGASGAHRLQFPLDNLVVDRRCVVTEGVMRIAYPATALRARGIEVPDPAAHYLYEARMCVVWPIDDDGLFVGEDAYAAGDGFAGIESRPVDLHDVVLHDGTAAA